MKKIKKIFEGKLFWLIISFLISLSVWVYVTSVETVESTKVFRNVQIELVGEETLLNVQNMMITDLDTQTVTLEIRGPRRIVNALEASDLTAQVDVSRLSLPAYKEPVYRSSNFTLVYPAGVDTRNLTVVRKSQDSVGFWVSKVKTTSIPVGGNFLGTVDGAYIRGTASYEPATITISGPEAYLNKVDHAYVEYGREDLTLESTYSEERSYTLVDKDNNPCPSEYITSSPENVLVTLPVLAQKEVPLTVALQEGSGATAENTRVTIVPSTLKLAGDSAVLDEINQIQLDIVDLTKFSTDYLQEYPIPIPNELRNLSQITKASVHIEILDVETKEFELEQFTWLGVSDDMEVIQESDRIPVLLRGPSSLMTRVTRYNLRGEADLSELMDQPGSYFVKVKVYVPGIRGVGPIQIDGIPDYTVAIRLVQKEDNT